MIDKREEGIATREKQRTCTAPFISYLSERSERRILIRSFVASLLRMTGRKHPDPSVISQGSLSFFLEIVDERVCTDFHNMIFL